MINKKNIIFSILIISTLILSISTFKILNTAATSDFIPTPDPPNENVYWGFDNDTIIGWRLTIYNGSNLMTQNDIYFNISATKYYKSYYSEYWEDNLDYYGVELTQLYFNTTTNTLNVSLDENDNPMMFNYSFVNFTYGGFGDFYSSNMEGMMIINPFIPMNNSELMVQWCADRLLDDYIFWLSSDPYSITTSIYDNTTKFQNDAGEFVETRYFSNGTLKSGEIFSYMGGTQPLGITFNYTRISDFNPLDDIEWSKDVGDLFYTGMIGNELQYNITGFVNDTTSSYLFIGLPIYVQYVLANISIWNCTSNLWEIFDSDVIIGVANEMYPIVLEALMTEGEGGPPVIVPTGTTGEDLAKAYSLFAMMDPAVEITYDDYWARLVNTTTGGDAFSEYFPNGLVKYIYTRGFMSPEDMVIFYKNSTLISTDYDFEIEPYGTDEFGIHVNISVSDDTHLLFAGMHLNPTNITLDDSLLFIDLFVNDTKNLVGLVNITIDYDFSKYGYVKAWHFNMSANGGKGAWEGIPFTVVDIDTIMISVDNLSFFALSAVPYPGAFGLYEDATDPDTDGKFKLWWDASSDADSYSIYKSSSPITTLTGSEILVESGITGLEKSITETANGTYYYVVVAINEAGQTLSNYVEVKVEISPEPEEGEEEEEEEEEEGEGVIPGFNSYIILILIATVSTILARRKQKKA